MAYRISIYSHMWHPWHSINSFGMIWNIGCQPNLIDVQRLCHVVLRWPDLANNHIFILLMNLFFNWTNLSNSSKFNAVGAFFLALHACLLPLYSTRNIFADVLIASYVECLFFRVWEHNQLPSYLFSTSTLNHTTHLI